MLENPTKCICWLECLHERFSLRLLSFVLNLLLNENTGFDISKSIIDLWNWKNHSSTNQKAQLFIYEMISCLCYGLGFYT